MANDRNLNQDGSLTLSTQLRAIIRDKILSGEWAPKAMIPSENKLGQMYGVSRMTVRNVITEFVYEGYLTRVPGKGTFVNENKFVISSLDYAGLRGQLESQGHNVSTDLISCRQIQAREPIAHKLDLQTDETVYEIKRVRSVNNTKISYHESYIPAKLSPDLEKKDLKNVQLCHIMNDNYSISRGHVDETLESNIADKSTAEHLDIEPGFPLILLQDVLYTPENVIYEYSRIYFRGDKMKLRINYTD